MEIPEKVIQGISLLWFLIVSAVVIICINGLAMLRDAEEAAKIAAGVTDSVAGESSVVPEQ